MGYFLTSKSRMEQTDYQGYWKLLNNELYMDDNGRLSITPRNFWTDGYTFPPIIMPITGDKNKLDVRPSHGHDLNCRFHECIYVNLSLSEVRKYLVFEKDKKTIICKDIPVKYLSIEPITKTDTDDKLKRMMLSCGISNLTCNVVRFGVFFNLNWWLRTGKKSLKEYNIYEDDIGLVDGV